MTHTIERMQEVRWLSHGSDWTAGHRPCANQPKNNATVEEMRMVLADLIHLQEIL